MPLTTLLSLKNRYYLRESKGGMEMRAFNYSLIREKKWDSEILGLVAAVYKEAGK